MMATPQSDTAAASIVCRRNGSRISTQASNAVTKGAVA